MKWLKTAASAFKVAGGFLSGIKIWLIVIAALGVAGKVGLHFWKYNALKTELSELKNEYSDHLEADKQAIIDAQEKARAAERKHENEISQISQQHTADQEAAKNLLDTLITDRDKRLRQRFTCPSPSVSDTQPTTSTGDEGQGTGLSEQDAEFLIRMAAEADDITRQLNACQAVVRADREIK